MRTAALSQEPEFLSIIDGHGIYYGGDQAWFEFTVGRYGGCGTVAAANITAYLAQNRRGMEALYDAPDRCRDHFLRHMEAVYPYVRPWKVPLIDPDRPPYKDFGWTLGIWSAGRLARGVERFAASRGIVMKGKRISSRHSLEELTDAVCQSLEQDCPVAMLIGNRPDYHQEVVTRTDGHCWHQHSFARHWVVITQLVAKDNAPVMVKVSTWGGYAWLDLEKWQEAKGLIGGIVSFGEMRS